MLGGYFTGFHPGFGYYLFAMLVGASLCGGYVLLGSTWLILKTQGELQKKALAWARWGLLWVALGVALVSLATPLVSHTVQAKWFDFPRTLALMLLPLATLAAGWQVWAATGRLKRGEREFEWMPLAATVAIFTLAFAGLAYSLFPYVVIDRMTIWEAASHPSALKFMLVGVAVVFPFLFGYPAFAVRVLRGRARAGMYEEVPAAQPCVSGARDTSARVFAAGARCLRCLGSWPEIVPIAAPVPAPMRAPNVALDVFFSPV